jgi:uncharacterized membrane protein YqgA involved in biofilm formation
MLGPLLNTAAIALGASLGWIWRGGPSPTLQFRLRIAATISTLAIGLLLIGKAFTLGSGNRLGSLAIAMVSLSLGNLTGRLLGLQRRLSAALEWSGLPRGTSSPGPLPWAAVSMVFALNPLGVVGSVADGALHLWHPLALKAVLDALAAWGFVATGSRGVAWSALPTLALTGTLSLGAGSLVDHGLGTSSLTTLQFLCGFLVLLLVPTVYGWQRVALANYLPSLILAPMLSRWWLGN